jgi:hypothetical protein
VARVSTAVKTSKLATFHLPVYHTQPCKFYNAAHSHIILQESNENGGWMHAHMYIHTNNHVCAHENAHMHTDKKGMGRKQI